MILIIFVFLLIPISANEMKKSARGILVQNISLGIPQEKKSNLKAYIALLDETAGTEYDQRSAKKQSKDSAFIIRKNSFQVYFSEPSEIIVAILRQTKTTLPDELAIAILYMTTNNSLFTFTPRFINTHKEKMSSILDSVREDTFIVPTEEKDSY